MFYDKDNNIFFKDFGEVAFTEDGNDFLVIFDNQYMEYNPLGSNANVSSRDIVVTVKNSDVQELNLKAKDLIQINDIHYSIKVIKLDSTGISEMSMQLVKDD